MQYGVEASRRYAGYAAYHHHIRLHCDPLTPFVATPEYEQAGEEVGIDRAIECWLENIDGAFHTGSLRPPDAFSKFASEFRKLYRTPTFERCPSFIPRKIDINWWSLGINILFFSSDFFERPNCYNRIEINMSILESNLFLHVSSSFVSLYRTRSFEGCSSFIVGRIDINW